MKLFRQHTAAEQAEKSDTTENSNTNPDYPIPDRPWDVPNEDKK